MRRLSRVVSGVGLLLSVCALSSPAAPAHVPAGNAAIAAPSEERLVAYFAQWGSYSRKYLVKNIHTSGSAKKLTHIVYAFGTVENGACAIGDPYADLERVYSAAESVDGVADCQEPGCLRGHFGQLRRLRKMYPHLKMLYSFGGWTWSAGFGEAAQNPAAFASSCVKLVQDPRWADVFDGIDISWLYPNACGIICDKSGHDSFPRLLEALRTAFGPRRIVTAVVTADVTGDKRIEKADYAKAARHVDWFGVLTYSFFGPWDGDGPTAPQSPLECYPGMPTPGFCVKTAMQAYAGLGIPRRKLLLGVSVHARGWTGVKGGGAGGLGGKAKGPASGTYEEGVEDYKLMASKRGEVYRIAGTSYKYDGSQWWGFDTPADIAGKASYQRREGFGGVFIWELSGDTNDGQLVTAARPAR
jgi:chitinase